MQLKVKECYLNIVDRITKKRIKDIFISDSMNNEDPFKKDKKDFLNFIKQYENRRGYNCLEFYPELKEFIKLIENENTI